MLSQALYHLATTMALYDIFYHIDMHVNYDFIAGHKINILNHYHSGYFYVLHSSLILIQIFVGFQILACIYKQSGKQCRSWEHSGSVVECLTRDRGAAGLSLTSVTALCP